MWLNFISAFSVTSSKKKVSESQIKDAMRKKLQKSQQAKRQHKPSADIIPDNLDGSESDQFYISCFLTLQQVFCHVFNLGKIFLVMISCNSFSVFMVLLWATY